MMENGHSFFTNRDCKYYPCHKGLEQINCLFCYCPLYWMKDCPGSPRFISKPQGYKKVCTDCTYPHRPENYERITALLKERCFLSEEEVDPDQSPVGDD